MTSKGDIDNVLVERLPLLVADKYLGLITLNRPEEMNPLDWSTVRNLRKNLDDLAADKRVCVIAFTGAGRAFSAGGDLQGYLTLQGDEEGFRGFLNDTKCMLNFIETLDRPVVALVNGFCVAGGLELLLACDFAYAAQSAKIGDGHVNFGQVGGGGSNVRLPRWVLPQRARELLFTGKLLSANEALEWGLVNRVAADGKLIEAALEFANIIATKSRLGLRIIKELCNRGLNMCVEDALHLEIQECHHYCLTSHDSREGLLAFSEKRQPKFEGR
jgi:enoyl-CoA hydratase/carnithine racemase